jgi:hypothetical protein
VVQPATSDEDGRGRERECSKSIGKHHSPNSRILLRRSSRTQPTAITHSFADEAHVTSNQMAFSNHSMEKCQHYYLQQCMLQRCWTPNVFPMVQHCVNDTSYLLPGVTEMQRNAVLCNNAGHNACAQRRHFQLPDSAVIGIAVSLVEMMWYKLRNY